MTESAPRPSTRRATESDISAICEFGRVHVRSHYTPLIGADAAESQVRTWWTTIAIGSAVGDGLIFIEDNGSELIGVAQLGRRGPDSVVYKLYVRPEHRSRGIGRQLLNTLIDALPTDEGRLFIEHFVANERAGAFYEREGFVVDHVEPSPSGEPRLDVIWRGRSPASAAEHRGNRSATERPASRD